MALWARIQSFFSTGLNALVSKAEDPEKLMELLLVEMESNYRQGRERVMACLAEEKRAEKRQGEEEATAHRYEEEATAALREGNADAAQSAVERKCVHEERGKRYAAIKEIHHGNAASLKGALETLSQQMNDAREERALLLAEKREAGDRAGQQRVLKQLQDREPTETLTRLLGEARMVRTPALEGSIAPSSEDADSGFSTESLSPDVSVQEHVIYDELARLKSLLEEEE
jgi:phage shock protein A